MCIREISNIILIFPKIGSIRPVQLKIKLPSPNSEIERVGGRRWGVARVPKVWIGRGSRTREKCKQGYGMM